MMSKELALFKAPLSGISLVEAGAGTGKTYNIASLFVRVILEKKLMPANILVLTYTEAATAELKTRLRNRIKESISALENKSGGDDEFLQQLSERFNQTDIEILKKAYYQFDEAAVSTIHGFCQRLLKENNLRFGISPEFEILADYGTLLQEVTDHFWRNFINNDYSEFQKALILFISQLGYFPDNLIERIQTTIEKPYATLLPKSKPLEVFEKDFNKLKQAFINAKIGFLKEEKEIKQVLHSELLNGNKYRNRKKHFDDVKKWFLSNEFTIKYPDRLYLFSSFMQGEGKKKDKVVPNLNVFKVVDHYLELASLFSEVELCWLNKACIEIKSAFEEIKENQDVLTYTDLLLKVENGLKKNTRLAQELSKKYPVALIDEFQDTDPVQYSIFQEIYYGTQNTALFMIGDPKQAIYSFRGADIFTYIEAREDADDNQKYSLSSNFRSSRTLIQSVNEIFEEGKDPFLIEDLPFNAAKFPTGKNPDELLLKKDNKIIEPLQFVEIESDDLTAEGIRNKITEGVCLETINLLSGDFHVNKDPVQESDIAILVRTHYQAMEIQSSLRNLGIKSIINSKESVFLTNEASELYLILLSIGDPSYEDRIRAALSTEAFGFSAEEIQHLLKNESAWDEIFQKFLTLNKLWREKGFLRMSNSLLNEFQVELNYAKYLDAERRITNVYHIIELLDEVERQNHCSTNGLLNYFKGKKNGQSNNKSDEEIVRLESDEKLVQIVTMHASKGLEYPFVLYPYLWEGISIKDRPFFSFHENSQLFIDIGSKNEERIQHREVKLNEDLAERVRLCYVALTRAKVSCLVFVIDGLDSELSPFSALLEGKEQIKQRIFDKLSFSSAKYKSTHKTENTKLTTLLKRFSSKSSLISYRESVEQKKDYLEFIRNDHKPFKTLSFTRSNLFDFKRITSFSSLSQRSKQNSDFELKSGFDYDEPIQIFSSRNEEIANKSIFSMPKGAKTGTLLHEIFEEIHFDDPNTFDNTIEKSIQKHGFSDIWIPVLKKLIEQTVNHDLYDGICLADLQKKDCLIEMEFHYMAESIELDRLISLIRGNNQNSESVPISGFMKGFIDLIFVRNGKYYILDYKSNFLGDSILDYDLASLEAEIKHSSYDLQYHIYVLALHKLLSKTVPDYSYDLHFGGVLYLFLRGIDLSKKGSAVYFDKPNFSVIEAFNSAFDRGGKG
ncbi:MAG: exodeoxyribonuclease V subunit beta [Balneolaceae bacterium]